MQYQTLKPDRILVTHRRLAERIAGRFPTSGLREVAGELGNIAEKAAATAEKIRRPNVPLRVAIYVLLAGALALGLWVVASLQLRADLGDARALSQLVGSTLQATVFLGAVIVFLFTLETRLKRRRALAALHELRAIAHIVDMHQLAKGPEGLRHEPDAGAAPQTTKTLYDLDRYLNYCNELLAIISKIAALYVQEFPDAPTVSAVDQVESLCSGLSEKIWQKIMILDRCLDQRPEGKPDRPKDGG